jgi:hypothetical protein
MKYAKSDKGYYVPKGKGQESTGSNEASATMANTGEPVRGETSLAFEDAGYMKSKDQYGNDLYIPKGVQKSGMLDYQAGEGEALHMKAYAYRKNPDGTFAPVVYDMKANKIDDFLTRESTDLLTGGMQLSGSTNLKGEAVGKLLYRNAIGNYQGGPMKKAIDKVQKTGQSATLPNVGPGVKWDVSQ